MPPLELYSQELYSIFTRILGSIPVCMCLPPLSHLVSRLDGSVYEGQIHVLPFFLLQQQIAQSVEQSRTLRSTS